MQIMSIGDIAKLAGVTRSAVAQWERRYADFPTPYAATTGGRLWLLEDIEKWLVKTGRLEERKDDEA